MNDEVQWAFCRELMQVLRRDDGFTGSIVLHCSQGRVVKYQTQRTHRPMYGDSVDLTEDAPREPDT